MVCTDEEEEVLLYFDLVYICVKHTCQSNLPEKHLDRRNIKTGFPIMEITIIKKKTGLTTLLSL